MSAKPFPMMIMGAMLLLPIAKPAWSEVDRQDIEAIVRDYLIANPEVVVDALRAYESKRQTEAEQAARAALLANQSSLEQDPTTPHAGRKDADITVVEFFDYRCGYCKKVLPTLQSLMEADPNVRVVFKELPILGPDSLRGALAAQAVWNIAPEKYLPFHVALMQTRGGIDESLIVETARKVGVDPDKLAAAMDDPSVKAKIESNLTLAQKLQINGTPAFVIGDKLLPGAVDLATIKETIADARSR